MPAQYERIRDSYLKRGKSEKEAKRLAAMTYNSQHPGNPMIPHRKRTRKRKHQMPRKDARGYY
jgi:hypothetical protein